MMAGSHNRAAVIASLTQYELEPEILRELLAYQWPMVDGSRGYANEILGLFRLAGYTTDEPGHAPLPVDDDGDVEIFRGNVGEDPYTGFSWTLDRKVAERFAAAPFQIRAQVLGYGAHREDGEEPIATVWGTWVDETAVLGYFNGRGEREVIIDHELAFYKPVIVAQAVPQEVSD